MEISPLFDIDVDNPYPKYAEWRSASPCFYDAGSQRHVITRFADAMAVLKNHRDFSSVRPIALKDERLANGGLPILLLADDPPRHTQVRSLVNGCFAAKAIAPLKTWVTTVVDDLLRTVDPNRMDVVAELAEPLPVMVIAKLLGMDPGKWRVYKRWSSIAAGLIDVPIGEHLREMVSLFGCLGPLVRSRRSSAFDDVMSHIIQQNDDATARLTDIELQQLALLLLSSGNETTTNLIGNLLDVLAQRPDVWSAFRAGKIQAESVIDETLRFESPIQLTTRMVVRDATVGGCSLTSGSAVGVCLGAANRDPAEFLQPEMFDPTRNLKRHLGFSHGVHFCLGAPLARLEAEIVLDAFASRYRKLDLLSTGTRIQSSIVRGFKSLPLRLVA